MFQMHCRRVLTERPLYRVFSRQCGGVANLTLWVSSLRSSETSLALTPATVIDLSDTHSFIQPCFFLCRSATHETHVGP
jgi:hypothetical protein